MRKKKYGIEGLFLHKFPFEVWRGLKGVLMSITLWVILPLRRSRTVI